MAARFGGNRPFTPTSIEQNGDFSVTVTADGINNARRFSFRCDVEEHAPHLIKMLEYRRLLDVDVTVARPAKAMPPLFPISSAAARSSWATRQ